MLSVKDFKKQVHEYIKQYQQENDTYRKKLIATRLYLFLECNTINDIEFMELLNIYTVFYKIEF